MTSRDPNTSRRAFIAKSGQLGCASMLTLGASAEGGGDAPIRSPSSTRPAGNTKQKLPRRMLGKTGVELAILGIGGGGGGGNPQIRGSKENPKVREMAQHILHRALDLGVNYIDSCTGYGASESVIGEVAASRRKDMFLATKCDKCPVPGDQLRRELEQSLELLRTDQIDLWQIHNIVTLDHVDTIFKRDHAIEVFQKAKDDGLARFIGITVHSSRQVIEETLRRCRTLGIEMDTLLMSFNATDQAGGGHGTQVLKDHPLIGKIAMKVFAGDSAAIIHREKLSAETALRYVLSHGFATAIVGMHTLEELEENVRIVRDFQPQSEDKLREIEQQIVGARPLRALTA